MHVAIGQQAQRWYIVWEWHTALSDAAMNVIGPLLPYWYAPNCETSIHSPFFATHFQPLKCMFGNTNLYTVKDRL